MKFDAKITRTFDDGNLKAFADITVNDSLAIHEVRVVEGKNGLFISMPSYRWKDKSGDFQYKDTVHPVTAEVRRELDGAVLSAYQDYILSAGEQGQSRGACL